MLSKFLFFQLHFIYHMIKKMRSIVTVVLAKLRNFYVNTCYLGTVKGRKIRFQHNFVHGLN
jgi:hypothetical protein